MSQGQGHKGPPLANELNGSTTQVPTAKAVDDSLIRNRRHEQNNQRSSRKHRIPKTVRYDLENALVGLCDVWFEEIKPHLVRNNIKLHVHGAASGDHERQEDLEPVSCSHHDPGAAPDVRAKFHRKSLPSCITITTPKDGQLANELNLPQRTGANYASFCLMHQTVSRAQSVKPPAYSRLKNQLLQRPTLSLQQVQNPHLVCEDMRAQRPFKSRKKRRSSQCEAYMNWRVPRLCRTYGTIPSAVTQLPSVINNNYVEDIRKRYMPTKYQCVSQRHQKSVMINKYTQTELSIPSGHVLSVSTHTNSQRDGTCSSLTAMRSRPSIKQERTTLLSSPILYNKKRASNKYPVLFQDDLLDIISKTHDKRLNVIYNSPEQVEYPSLMYLMSHNKPKKGRGPRKTPPWR